MYNRMKPPYFSLNIGLLFSYLFRIRIRIRIRIVYFGSGSDPDPAKSFGFLRTDPQHWEKDCSSRLYYFLQPLKRGLYRVWAVLARQRFLAAPYSSVVDQEWFFRIQILLFSFVSDPVRLQFRILHEFFLIFLTLILPLYSCLKIVLGCILWQDINFF